MLPVLARFLTCVRLFFFVRGTTGSTNDIDSPGRSVNAGAGLGGRLGIVRFRWFGFVGCASWVAAVIVFDPFLRILRVVHLVGHSQSRNFASRLLCTRPAARLLKIRSLCSVTWSVWLHLYSSVRRQGHDPRSFTWAHAKDANPSQ